MEEWRAYLDLFVVPVAFIVYLGYHLILLYRTLVLPETTHFSSKIHQRRISLQHIFQAEVNDRGAFFTEMSTNISSASTYGSYSLTLIPMTGVLGSISNALGPIVYGDSSGGRQAIKYACIFVFGLVAFLCFKVGAKTLGHANFLINMPRPAAQHDYIDGVVVRGFVLIEVGNRSFYFLLALETWFLGPMWMLAFCLMLLVWLYNKDKQTIPPEDSNRHIELSPV